MSCYLKFYGCKVNVSLTCRLQKKILFLLIVSVSLTVSNGWELECFFTDLAFWAVSGAQYSCQGSFERSDASFTDVVYLSGNNRPGKTNLDVKALQLYDQRITFMPRGVEKFFPNLEVFDAPYSDIQFIGDGHFSGLNNLKVMSFYYNNMMMVSAMTFTGLTKLQAISFYGNPIQCVDQAAFSQLPDLRSLRFENTGCINEGVENNANLVISLIYRAAANCPMSNCMF